MVKCQKCMKNEANIHFKCVLNGTSRECYLCSECMGLSAEMFESCSSAMLSDFDSDNGIVDTIIGSCFGGEESNEPIVKEICSVCGANELDFSRSGKLGCCNCYNTFQLSLAPTLKQMYGDAVHVGKTPLRLGDILDREYELQELKERLKLLVKAQKFEAAATLRDRIKELEREAT